MKRCLALCLLLLSLLGSAGGAWAQGYWRDLPPEDRRRLRDDMREQRAWQEQRGQRGFAEPREGRGGGRGWRRD